MTVKAWTFMPRTLATGALRRTATLRPVKAERATVEVERVKADIFIMFVSVTCCDLRGRPTIGVYSLNSRLKLQRCHGGTGGQRTVIARCAVLRVYPQI